MQDDTSDDYDAVVVGAGPAGALAALGLAREGFEVLLVEKAAWPRWKVCGCCLNLNALSALRDAGLGDLPMANGGKPLDTFHVGAGGNTARVKLPGGVALSRERFDAALVEAAIKAGAAFVQETHAHIDRIAGDRRVVFLESAEETREVHAKIVVSAQGLGGKLLHGSDVITAPAELDARIGAGALLDDVSADYRPGTIYMACGRHGYVGLVRLEDDRLDVAAAFDPAFVKRAGGLPEAATEVIEEARFPRVDGMADARWKGTPALTRRANRISSERMFVVGDAAGYVEPFTGEGMAWALASGVAVVPIAARAIGSWKGGLEQEWNNRHQQTVCERQTLCRLLSWGLRRPGLVRMSVGVVSRMPVVARPFVRHLNAPSTQKASL